MAGLLDAMQGFAVIGIVIAVGCYLLVYGFVLRGLDTLYLVSCW